ncbi:MAG: CHASE2 domain-containing protein [Pseudomonadota bacterium]
MRDRIFPHLWQQIVVALSVGLVLAGLQASFVGQRIEHGGGLTWLYWLRGTVAPPDGAVILALDDAGAEWVGFHARDPGRVSARLDGCLTPEDRGDLAGLSNPLAVPRVLYACALDALVAAGARVVAFDVVFRRQGDPRADARLAGAMAAARAAGTSIVLLEGVDRQVGDLLRRERPAPHLRAEADATGMFRVGTDSTGLVIEIEETLFSFPDLGSFPAAASAAWQGALDGREGVPVPERYRGTMPWYYGPPGTLAMIDLPTVFADDPAMAKRRAAIAGRAVFVGLADLDRVAEKDHFRTVVAGGAADAMPGVEIAATVFLNRLNGMTLRPVSLAAGVPVGALEFVLTAMAGVVGCLAVLKLSGWHGALAVFALAAGLMAVSVSVFVSAALWLPVATPSGGLFVLGVVGALGGYARTRAGLAARLPTPVAERVRAQDGGEALEMRPITAAVMFADIAGSTTLASRVDAATYAAVLTDFQKAAVAGVAENRGIVVEIEGDGLLAAFALDEGGEATALRACLAARAVAEAAGERRLLERPLAVRIGISWGDVMMGETEAGGRLGLRVIGDPVNVADRLQRVAKRCSASHTSTIIVADGIRQRARHALGDAAFEPLGETILEGREVPSILWKLIISNYDPDEL